MRKNWNGKTLEPLTDITKACEVCQKYAADPATSSVRYPEDAVFLKSLLFLRKAQAPHMMESGIKFSTVRFLQHVETDPIWNTCTMAWIILYTGYPGHINIDNVSIFTSNQWRKQFIHTSRSGTESHDALEEGETFHSVLPLFINTVHYTHPQLSRFVCSYQ